MNILLYTCNQINSLKLAIRTIEYLKTMWPLEFYIVDNYSTDGTVTWLQEQPHLNFLAFDEGKEKISVVLNTAINEFGIAEDILVMRPNYMLMPNTIIGLERFVDNLAVKRAIVGLYCNSFQYTQFINLDKYSADITFDESMDLSYKVELFVNPNAFFFHKDVYERVDKFDDNFGNILECMEDFSLRAIKLDVPIVVPMAPIAVFDIDPGNTGINSEFLFDRDILKEKWGMNYFSLKPNYLIVDTVVKSKKDKLNVLEIGCDNGATLIEIHNKMPNAKIFGVELNEMAADIASHFAEIYVGDIEKNFPYEGMSFDFIIFGDVLEHLSNPEKILEICAEHLCTDGRIVASVPNVMHISLISELLKGNFEYSDLGLLDRTHVHLFTYNEIVKMFKKLGLNSLEIYNIKQREFTERENEVVEVLLSLEPLAERFMYEAYQYFVIAGK